jgi:hypothetical protein
MTGTAHYKGLGNWLRSRHIFTTYVVLYPSLHRESLIRTLYPDHVTFPPHNPPPLPRDLLIWCASAVRLDLRIKLV